VTGAASTPAAPVIVAADFGPADFAWLDRLRREHFPAERNQLPAHLMLFHHLPPSLLPELDTRLKVETRALRRPEASIGEAMLLGRGVALRVRCRALEVLREGLVDAFTGMLTPQDAAGWRPHVTIQNKVEPAEAKALHRRMAVEYGDTRPLTLTGVATYFYRGGPWEPIARYRFAG
jgi:hypothetical protein